MAEEKETSKEDKSVPMWLGPVLMAIGSMGGSYLLWVKPLQDSFKLMTDQIEALRAEVKELKEKQKESLQKVKNDALNDMSNEENDELLPPGKVQYVKKASRKKQFIILK